MRPASALLAISDGKMKIHCSQDVHCIGLQESQMLLCIVYLNVFQCSFVPDWSSQIYSRIQIWLGIIAALMQLFLEMQMSAFTELYPTYFDRVGWPTAVWSLSFPNFMGSFILN